jgi:hypothetical protein
MNISDYPEVVEAINVILARRGVVEIKLEGRDDQLKLVIVETSRQVKHKTPAKQ